MRPERAARGRSAAKPVRGVLDHEQAVRGRRSRRSRPSRRRRRRSAPARSRACARVIAASTRRSSRFSVSGRMSTNTGRGAAQHERVGRRHERERGHDHLVARADDGAGRGARQRRDGPADPRGADRGRPLARQAPCHAAPGLRPGSPRRTVRRAAGATSHAWARAACGPDDRSDDRARRSARAGAHVRPLVRARRGGRSHGSVDVGARPGRCHALCQRPVRPELHRSAALPGRRDLAGVHELRLSGLRPTAPALRAAGVGGRPPGDGGRPREIHAMAL